MPVCATLRMREPVCRLRKRHTGARMQVRAPRARLFALSFRTPLRRRKTPEDRRALGPEVTRGDDARVCVCVCSPDGAQRNPGFLPRTQPPDFAALHPGYEEPGFYEEPGLFDN